MHCTQALLLTLATLTHMGSGAVVYRPPPRPLHHTPSHSNTSSTDDLTKRFLGFDHFKILLNRYPGENCGWSMEKDYAEDGRIGTFVETWKWEYGVAHSYCLGGKDHFQSLAWAPVVNHLVLKDYGQCRIHVHSDIQCRDEPIEDVDWVNTEKMLYQCHPLTTLGKKKAMALRVECRKGNARKGEWPLAGQKYDPIKGQ